MKILDIIRNVKKKKTIRFLKERKFVLILLNPRKSTYYSKSPYSVSIVNFKENFLKRILYIFDYFTNKKPGEKLRLKNSVIGQQNICNTWNPIFFKYAIFYCVYFLYSTNKYLYSTEKLRDNAEKNAGKGTCPPPSRVTSAPPPSLPFIVDKTHLLYTLSRHFISNQALKRRQKNNVSENPMKEFFSYPKNIQKSEKREKIILHGIRRNQNC